MTTETKPLSPAEALKVLNPKYINDLGLVNLKRDERVTFKVTQKPIKARDTSGQEKEIYKSSQRVPNTCVVFDGKDMHEIAYPEEISFTRETNSEIVITGREPHKFALLWYLRMSNNNISNPSALQGSEYIFEEVAELVKSQSDLDRELDLSDMVNVINSKSLEDLSQICRQLNISAGENQVDVKMTLINYIKNEGQRLKFKGIVINKIGSYKELIKNAMELDLLALDNDTKMWSRRMDGENISDITQVTIGEDPKDFLVKYFISDDRGKKLKTFFEEKTKAILAERKAAQVSKGL